MPSNSMVKDGATNDIVYGEQTFRRLPVPTLKYEQERWSTTRSQNVAKIAETWRVNPGLVRIFHDPKFGQMQMAMLRKDQLEALLKTVKDLKSGQAAIQLDARALVDAITLVQQLVERESSLHGDDGADEPPLSKAVNLMVHVWGKISSTLLVRAPTRQVQPSPLSEEEKQPLED